MFACQKIRGCKSEHRYIQYKDIETFGGRICVLIFMSDFLDQNVSKYFEQFSIKKFIKTSYSSKSLYTLAQNVSIAQGGKMFQIFY